MEPSLKQESRPILGRWSNIKCLKRGQKEVFWFWHRMCQQPDHMETVNIQQMKSALSKLVGSKFPAKFTLINGDVVVRYVRGYADQQTNILLISETSYSLAMKILEVKDIAVLEYAPSPSEAQWVRLQAKWAGKKREKI